MASPAGATSSSRYITFRAPATPSSSSAAPNGGSLTSTPAASGGGLYGSELESTLAALAAGGAVDRSPVADTSHGQSADYLRGTDGATPRGDRGALVEFLRKDVLDHVSANISSAVQTRIHSTLLALLPQVRIACQYRNHLTAI